jgi:NADP-dependent 3-hydroxy acid dehydrogenase YdfG
LAKTILVCGYGPGISNAVAEKFGAEGFSVALAARDAKRLEAGVKALDAKGIKAAAFPSDLADPAAAGPLVSKAHAALGPIAVILWNAYSNAAGDLLTADLKEVRAVLDMPVLSLLAVVRAALPDLRKAEDAAVLITNGGLAFTDPQVNAVGVDWKAMGLSVANAAKHKLAGMLSHRLKGDRIYVGEVIVSGTVKGTAFDTAGQATIDPRAVAEKFWSLYRGRTELWVQHS